MAHGDYNCCAVCDCKLEYAGWDAVSKARICEDCLLKLQEMNLPIVTVWQLIEWIKNEEIETLKTKLKELGFRGCYYENDVDEAVKSRGINWDWRTGVIE
ncbi:hypothetical protein KVG29_08730 [Caldicoprobacter algeriensis]|uniref:hypothetical protein n=1 Tax=Caldicoprobacter algeriensis TaxID=699281 RepID=UPI0020795C13|nr:hypothetical protein [Caldicoprobacter algeriensis]MCM8901303.1 hypothetical protein [Caldicoprobacter algeriensis]